MYDLVVIGAGAAGLFAAGRAAELGAKVLIIEKNDRPGRKLLITGKGRCNITNIAPHREYIKMIQPNGRFLNHAFGHFFHEDVVTLLTIQGMKCVVERGGRVFPASEKSADVLAALLKWLADGQVVFKYRCQAMELLVEHATCKGVLIRNHKHQEEKIRGQCTLLATGGQSYPATGSTGDGYTLAAKAGHEIIALRPALVPVVTAGQLAQRMQGLSLKNVRATVWEDGRKTGDDFGEMLFTHFGLSGPIILSLSRLLVDGLNRKGNMEVSIDLKPALDEPQLNKRLLRDLDAHGKMKMANLFREWLPSAMIPVFLSENGIDPDKPAHQLTGEERNNVLRMMKNLRFHITGHRSYNEAIITAGGVSTAEINPKTMESRLVKNLFMAGEVLDLDAPTGGYNLQIAWSTGWLAGQSAYQAINAQHQQSPSPP